jgi:putative FmdB family regulatory protein
MTHPPSTIPSYRIAQSLWRVLPMPIYEYECGKCAASFELLVRGDELPICPECGGKKLEKLLSVPAAHMAGGDLPVCEAPRRGPCGMGGCGMPECG